MTTDTIPIELTVAERHVLTHLLDNYIRQSPWETIRFADDSGEIQKGAEQARLLAQLQALGEGIAALPLADLDDQRSKLVGWAEETDETTSEHDAILADYDNQPGAEWVEPENALQRKEGMDSLRQLSAIDYAHKCVCERIISQIDAAREPVAA